jgi:hypothetical protein
VTNRLLLAAVLALLVAPAAAHAGPIIDRAVTCLDSQPVCVDPAVRRQLSGAEADALAQKIRSAGAGPVFVAVLPEAAKAEAGGTAADVVRVIHRELGRTGTYAVVAGGSFRAGTTSGFRAGPLADAAFAEHSSEGLAPVLTDFVDRVGEAREGGGGSAEPASGGGGGDGGSSGLAVGLLALVGLGGGAVYLNGRRQRRLREERELAEVKHVARDDLVALGDDIRALDLDVEIPGADPAAKAEYGRAVELYDRANQGFEAARRPEDLAPVTQALEEARWAMSSARARMNGEQPPERRPPCFFDPRHGRPPATWSGRRREARRGRCPRARPTRRVWRRASTRTCARSTSAAARSRTGTRPRTTAAGQGGTSAASGAASSAASSRPRCSAAGAEAGARTCSWAKAELGTSAAEAGTSAAATSAAAEISAAATSSPLLTLAAYNRPNSATKRRRLSRAARRAE